MRAPATAASCLRWRWTPSKPKTESEKGLDEESVEFQCPRGRADRAFPPSGLAKIFGDDAGVLSRHWLAGCDRLYQRAIRSEELVPIVAVGVVEQFAQRLRRNGLRLVHARERIAAGLTNG